MRSMRHSRSLTGTFVAAVVCLVAAVLVPGAASAQSPVRTNQVECATTRSSTCTPGRLTAPSGATGQVTLAGSGALSGTLFSRMDVPNYTCPEWTPRGKDQLWFNFTRTTGTPTPRRFKIATLTETLPTRVTASRLEVCFQSPTDFPAKLPSQFRADLRARNFRNNTLRTPEPGKPDQYNGLLLPCSYGYGVPCVAQRRVVRMTWSTWKVTVTVHAPVGDPKVRF